MPITYCPDVAVNIISNRPEVKEMHVFQNCKRLALEFWPQDIPALAEQIIQQETDILCLFSHTETRQTLSLCLALETHIKSGLLSVFVITADTEKGYIEALYNTGIDSLFSHQIFDSHLSHHLERKQRQILRQKQLAYKNQQQDYLCQLAKLYDFIWEVDQKIFRLTPETKELLAVKEEGLMLNQWACLENIQLINDSDASSLLKEASERQQSIKFKVQINHPSLGMRDVLMMAQLDNQDTNNAIYRGCFQDISGYELSADSVQHLAYHDSLTGLANRRHLINHLQTLTFNYKKTKHPFSLLFLDLDSFKQVNDQLGHETGDLLLIEVSQHLESISEQGYFSARLGGDEFCIVIETKGNEKEASAIAEKIIETFKYSVFLEKYRVQTSFSIGIAHFPSHGSSVSELLRAADMAMYEAKSHGKHCYEVYHPILAKRNLQRIEMESSLMNAYQLNQFELYYQPQINLSTQKIIGLEALIRWIHPSKGLIPPVDFIPIAEDTRMIHNIGEWVLKKACEETKVLHDKGLKISIAVNISPIQLYSENFYDKVKNALDITGLEAKFLELEITESTFQISEKNIRVFEKLRALGVMIAIDDFGTGYSNLSSLNQLPIDVLKIDREFIKDIPHNDASAAMTASIIGMAKIKQLKIVAEGIETLEQIQYLQGVNCDIGQGFFIGKPMEFTQIKMFLKRQLPKQTLTIEH